MRLPESSICGLQTARQGRVSIWFRRGTLGLLLLVVLTGVTGLLGAHVRNTSASESGWSLSLRYAAIARAGYDVPWQVTVRRDGGFQGEDITLAVTGAYFDIFETQGFHPEPSDEARDGDTLFLTFKAPPSGDTAVIAYDAYIQPTSQAGRSGEIGVVDGGRRTATVHFRTRLLP